MKLPKSVGKMEKDECALYLIEALENSSIESKAELSKLTGIPPSTLSSYFNGIYKPSQENWNTIRDYLCPETAEKNKLSVDDTQSAEYRTKRINAQLFLLKDELNFFKDQPPESREILKASSDMEETGYIISLLKAIYNEEELALWKAL